MGLVALCKCAIFLGGSSSSEVGVLVRAPPTGCFALFIAPPGVMKPLRTPGGHVHTRGIVPTEYQNYGGGSTLKTSLFSGCCTGREARISVCAPPTSWFALFGAPPGVMKLFRTPGVTYTPGVVPTEYQNYGGGTTLKTGLFKKTI